MEALPRFTDTIQAANIINRFSVKKVTKIKIYANPPTNRRGIRIIVKLIALAFTATWATQAHATVYFITPEESIEVAVSSAADGDTIVLEAGIYFESVVVINQSVTIGSRFLLNGDTSAITSTIVFASNTRPDTNSCFALFGSTPSSYRIIGLSMQGGSGTQIEIDGIPYLYGGGVIVRNARVFLEHCEIRACTAAYGGGLSLERDVNADTVSAYVHSVKITNCDAIGTSGYGGGIWSSRYKSTIRGVRIDECTAGFSGGGVNIGGARFIVDSCQIAHCSGARTGGIVAYSSDNYSRSSIVKNSVFQENGVLEATPEGICHLETSGSVIVSGNSFSSNSSSDIGIWVSDYDDNFNGVHFFTGNLFEHHRMDDPTLAGAIYFFDCIGQVSYNIFRNNYGYHGATIIPTGNGAPTRFHHNVFRDNEMASDGIGGSAIYINAITNSFRIDSNLFVNNFAPSIGYDSLYVPNQIRAENNWWDHESGPFHPERNSQGQGDTLLGSVIDFDPWLTFLPDSTSAVRQVTLQPISSTWELLPVYPNPFNSQLTISLAGIMGDSFTLKLYDTLGREVATLLQGRGHGQMIHYTAPRTLASGVYFLQASEGKYSDIRKVVFLK